MSNGANCWTCRSLVDTWFKSLDPALLSRILGGFVLCYGAYQLLPLPTLRVTRLSALPYGTLGGRIHTNISQDTFRRVISTLLLFSGCALMLKY